MSAPRLPAALLDDGWREVDHESKDELSTPVFSVRSHNRIYEHAASADGHRGLVAVELGTGLRSAFTTGLEFDPPLSRFGVSPGSSSNAPAGSSPAASARTASSTSPTPTAGGSNGPTGPERGPFATTPGSRFTPRWRCRATPVKRVTAAGPAVEDGT
jgi:hypothetical protein